MDVNYLKRVAIGFISIVLVLAVFVYVVFHLTNGFTPQIATTPALQGEYMERDGSVGYIFRYETPVASDFLGTVNYNVADGEKVKLGQLAATVYEHGSEKKLTSQMVEIDRMIELLSRSNISDNVSVSDPQSVDDEIQKHITTLIKNKREGNYSAASDLGTELLISLNRRELIVSSKTSYDEQIALLRSERALLAAQLTGENKPVYVAQSGYFYYSCDGYEKLFDPDLLDGMTTADFDALVSETADSTRYVGKNVTAQKWYLALKLDRTELGKYTVGNTYKIAFHDYTDMNITMKLESVNAASLEGLLVFSSNEMPEGFDFERTQSVSVIVREHDGLRFPASALRLYDGAEGVYVLYGNTVFFRLAKVIARENGYAYVEADGEPFVVSEGDAEGNGRVVWQPVALYDEIIVAGTGLYHGMIVN